MSKSITEAILSNVNNILTEMPEGGDSPMGLLGRVLDTATGLGWSYDETNFANDEGGYEFYQYSPAGEDFSFAACYGKKDLSEDEKGANLIEDIISYADDFDEEEHAEMWIGGNGAPGLKALVQDAADIQDMLTTLADELMKINHPMNESYTYNWKDDVEDIEATPENDDIWYAVAENMCETGNNEGYGSDPYEVMSNIINLFKISKKSRLYKYLLKWYKSEENLLNNVRDVYETNDAIYFTTGSGYAILDADLLGGNADGTTEKKFSAFVDKEEGLNEGVLNPEFSSRKSFYGKAGTDDTAEGKVLTSYGTKIMRIKDGNITMLCRPEHLTNTTLRHIREFLLQNGLEPLTKKQLIELIGKNESLKESDEDGIKSFEEWKDSPDYWVRVNDTYGVDSETDLETHEVSEEDLKNLYDEYVKAAKEGKEYTQKDLQDLADSPEETSMSEDGIPYDNTTEKFCPRCGRTYTQFPAVSRFNNKTYICPDCGTEEAMINAVGGKLGSPHVYDIETGILLSDKERQARFNESAKVKLTEAPTDISEEEEEYELVDNAPEEELPPAPEEEMSDNEYEEEAEDDAKETVKDDIEEPFYATTPEFDELRDILVDLDYRLFLINDNMVCIGRLNGPDIEFLTSNTPNVKDDADVSEANDKAEEVEERAEENEEDSFEYLWVKAPDTFDKFVNQVNVVYLSPDMSDEDKEQYAGIEASHESVMNFLMNELPEDLRKEHEKEIPEEEPVEEPIEELPPVEEPIEEPTEEEPIEDEEEEEKK